MSTGDGILTPIVEAVQQLPDGGQGRICVGYSGGLDSTVLLHAANALFSSRVLALHVNHGLHADACAWRQHCAEVCTAWQVPLESREVEVAGGNLEAAARAARYDYFESVLRPEDALLLAHHQDDQAETLLLHMAQGRGVFGMPARRPLGRGTLLRPLLDVPRTAIHAYACRHGLRWVEDPSNLDESRDRNFLRARVMPLLHGRWPGIGGVLQDVLRRRRLVDELAVGNLDLAAESLPVAALLHRSPEAAVEMLRIWLLGRYAVAPSGRSLRSFVAQLHALPDRRPALGLATGSLRRYRERVFHVPEPPLLEPAYAAEVPGTVVLPHGEVAITASEDGGFATAGPVQIVFLSSPSVSGAKLQIRGHHRSVRKLLQEAGIPPWAREHYPLLVDDGGIACVPEIACRDVGADENAARWRASWNVR